MVIDAGGLAVAPGFINMLSWATESLIEDGRSQSDIRQGVTLEVMGEGWSMGPLNEAMKAEMLKRQGDIKYDIEWTTLGEYLDYLEKSGISNNVASFIGATTVRIHELGEEDRPPTAGGTGADESTGGPGHGGRGAGCRLVADLCPGVLFHHRGTDRTQPSRFPLRRTLHFPHSQ